MQDLLKTLALGFALGAGPRSGIGTGALEGINTPAGALPRPRLDVCLEPPAYVSSFDDMKKAMDYLTCQTKNQSKLAQWQACLAARQTVCAYR